MVYGSVGFDLLFSFGCHSRIKKESNTVRVTLNRKPLYPGFIVQVSTGTRQWFWHQHIHDGPGFVIIFLPSIWCGHSILIPPWPCALKRYLSFIRNCCTDLTGFIFCSWGSCVWSTFQVFLCLFTINAATVNASSPGPPLFTAERSWALGRKFFYAERPCSIPWSTTECLEHKMLKLLWTAVAMDSVWNKLNGS